MARGYKSTGGVCNHFLKKKVKITLSITTRQHAFLAVCSTYKVDITLPSLSTQISVSDRSKTRKSKDFNLVTCEKNQSDVKLKKLEVLILSSSIVQQLSQPQKKMCPAKRKGYLRRHIVLVRQ